MTNPYVDGELINSAKLFDRIESRLDALEATAAWQTITGLNTGTPGYTTSGSIGEQQLTGDGVRIRGLFTRTSGNVTVDDVVFTFNGGLTFATNLYRIPFQSNGTVSGFLAVSTTGVVTVAQVSGTTNGIRPAQTIIPLN